MEPLKTYEVYVKMIVYGESEVDALDTANAAVDSSDLLDQDGVLGLEVTDDVSEEEELDDE